MTKSTPNPESPTPASPETPESKVQPAVTRAFVDGLEEGKARLLLEDAHGEWQTYHLPAAVLPADVKEGSWLELTARSTAAPTQYDSRGPREKLGRNDKGGNFSL